MDNLPPGVSVNDIPGNRPEDITEEKFWEELDARFMNQFGDKGEKWLTLLEDLDPDDMIIEYVRVARELAYETGYKEAEHELDMQMENHYKDPEDE